MNGTVSKSVAITVENSHDRQLAEDLNLHNIMDAEGGELVPMGQICTLPDNCHL